MGAPAEQRSRASPGARRSPLVVAAQLLLVVTGLVGLALFALAEILLAWPVEWWLYASLVPCFVLGLLRSVPLGQQRGRLLSIGLLVALTAALHGVPWTTRKPFLRDLDRIEVGLDEAQVRQIMDGYIEGTGWPARVPGATQDVQQVIDPMGGGTHATARTAAGEMGVADSIVFRHSTDAHLNSDWGIVRFQDGRVVGVSFSPD